MSVPTIAISIPKKSLPSIRFSLQTTFLLDPSGNRFVKNGNKFSASYISFLLGNVSDMGGRSDATYSAL